MKVGILTLAYNEARFIKACIRQFDGFPVAKHLVLVSQKPWHGEALEDDGTAMIAHRAGALPILGEWETEADQRNLGMELLKDMDWVLIVDADELYVNASLSALFAFLEHAATAPAYGIGKLKTYWKDTRHIIHPEEKGGLIVAVRPHVRFTDKRCIDSAWDFLPPRILMHHLSYVRTDAEMRKKITTFEHQHEIVPQWYENVWLKFHPDMKNLHPVNPKSFRSTRFAPLPDALEELLDAV